MPCMVGKRFSTPKDSWVTGYISCPRPWESVVQLEILLTPILSPWKTLLLTKWSSHLSNFIRKETTNLFFFILGPGVWAFLGKEVSILWIRMSIYSTPATVCKFPMCILLICIKAILCSVATFPRCTMQSFSLQGAKMSWQEFSSHLNNKYRS